MLISWATFKILFILCQPGVLSLKAQKGPHGLLTFIKFISYLFLYNVGTGCTQTFSAPFLFFFFCITLLLITLKCTQLGVGIIVVVQASLLPHYTRTFQLGLFDFSIIVWGPTILSHPVLHCVYEWMIFHCVVKSHFWLFLIVGHVGYFWFLPIQHKATYRVLFCFGGMWGVYSASWVCTRKCNSGNIWRLCV